MNKILLLKINQLPNLKDKPEIELSIELKFLTLYCWNFGLVTLQFYS